jgi:hypothetical protein
VPGLQASSAIALIVMLAPGLAWIDMQPVKWIKSEADSGTPADCDARKSPSVFGRLVAVALRCAEPGSQQHGKADRIWVVESVQREAHRAAFDEWLDLNLAQKWADLQVYAAWSSSDVKAVIGQWLSSERQRRLMPQDVLEAESALFLGDLDVLRRLSLERS